MGNVYMEADEVRFKHKDYHNVQTALVAALEGGGGGGTSDYEDLENLPKINSVELKGNKSLADLGIQGKLTAGTGITIEDGVISATGGGNDIFTVTITTKSTGGQDASITVKQYVNGAEVASTDYLYSALSTPVTIHDFMTIAYANMKFSYTLLRASFTHSSGYSVEWPFESTVSYEEGCFYTAPTV